METQTSNSASNEVPQAAAAVLRDRGRHSVEAAALFDTAETLGRAAKIVDGVWTTEIIGINPAPTAVTAPVSMAPTCVYAFVQAVAQIQSVRCVVAEEAEGCVHITTFVHPHSQEDAERIYSVEAKIIRANPGVAFDFHVRKAAEAESGTPDIVSGAQFFVVWGDLENAGAR